MNVPHKIRGRIQLNIANSLKALGERQSGNEDLELSIKAYREALKEFTKDRDPMDWAAVKTSLANALSESAIRKNDAEPLKEAIAAYRRP